MTPAQLLGDICTTDGGYMRRSEIERMGIKAQWALVHLIELELVFIVEHRIWKQDVVRPMLYKFGTYHRVPQDGVGNRNWRVA